VIEGFVVGKKENRDVVDRWRQRSQPAALELFRRATSSHRLARLDGSFILTDSERRQTQDVVSPLFPEHRFFLDELVRDRVRGRSVLEVGQGAGALSVALVKAGARQVTAVESNPRARAFAGFNCLLNRCVDRVVTVEAPSEDPYRPVSGQTFDY